MKYKFLSLLAICGLAFFAYNAMATNTTNTANATNAVNTEKKPVNKISDVQAMPDDAEVVIQGVIVQNLGDDSYLVKDDSGTVNIEIDEDLVQGNTITPEAEVLITATVDKDGDVTSLDAEEVQFIPTNNDATVNAPAN